MEVSTLDITEFAKIQKFMFAALVTVQRVKAKAPS